MQPLSLKSFFKDFAAVAAGATLGEEHLSWIMSQLAVQPPSTAVETLVVIDFDGIEDATASYIKATVLTPYQCGRLYLGALGYAEGAEHSHVLRPLNIVVAVVNANAAISSCIDDVFGRRSLGILAGSSIQDDRFTEAVLLGEVDPKVEHTLRLSSQQETCTASDLHSRYPEENISVTGWNNRLSDLHRMRLIRRRTEGRTNVFLPLTKHLSVHGKILSR